MDSKTSYMYNSNFILECSESSVIFLSPTKIINLSNQRHLSEVPDPCEDTAGRRCLFLEDFDVSQLTSHDSTAASACQLGPGRMWHARRRPTARNASRACVNVPSGKGPGKAAETTSARTVAGWWTPPDRSLHPERSDSRCSAGFECVQGKTHANYRKRR